MLEGVHKTVKEHLKYVLFSIGSLQPLLFQLVFTVGRGRPYI